MFRQKRKGKNNIWYVEGPIKIIITVMFMNMNISRLYVLGRIEREEEKMDVKSYEVHTLHFIELDR